MKIERWKKAGDEKLRMINEIEYIWWIEVILNKASEKEMNIWKKTRKIEMKNRVFWRENLKWKARASS